MPEDVPSPTVEARYYDYLVTSAVAVLFLSFLSTFAVSSIVALDARIDVGTRFLIFPLTLIAVALFIFGVLKLSMRSDVHWSLPAGGWLLLVPILLLMSVLNYRGPFWLVVLFTMVPSLILYFHWYRDRQRRAGAL